MRGVEDHKNQPVKGEGVRCEGCRRSKESASEG